MSLKDQFAVDADILINADEFAEEVAYNGISILAVTELMQDNEEGNTFSDDGSSTIRKFTIKKSDVSSPKSGDKIIYDSENWYFARILEDFGGGYTLAFTGNESAITYGR